MTWLIPLLLFALGILLLLKGGDWFVGAASWIAEVSGIPKFIVGATIVSVATTLPELLVSVIAAFDGKVDIAVGNAVGSVTANIGLIMAVSILCIPAVIKRRELLAKALIMLFSSVLIFILGLFFKSISVLWGVLLILVFCLYIAENVKSAKSLNNEAENIRRSVKNKKEAAGYILKFLFGVTGIVIGARLLVDNGSELARLIGIDERIIAVTFVAVGTSLPELVTTITAVLKKESSLSVGNIIGANIIDLTLIMPLCSVISGGSLPISQNSAYIDNAACVIIGSAALIPALISGRFRRYQGIVLLALYLIYIVITCFFS